MKKQLTVILLSALLLSGCASGRMGNPGAIMAAPSADRPHQGDVRQGAVGQIPASAQRPLHLQERRNVDGQLL